MTKKIGFTYGQIVFVRIIGIDKLTTPLATYSNPLLYNDYTNNNSVPNRNTKAVNLYVTKLDLAIRSLDGQILIFK